MSIALRSNTRSAYHEASATDLELGGRVVSPQANARALAADKAARTARGTAHAAIAQAKAEAEAAGAERVAQARLAAAEAVAEAERQAAEAVWASCCGLAPTIPHRMGR
eukprot:COSAG01_NODE_1258_length_11012_cov_18.155136_2_plen_109_part_00